MVQRRPPFWSPLSDVERSLDPAQASECVTIDLVAKGCPWMRRGSQRSTSSDGGLAPLIQTVIQVRGTCVLAHFSALAESRADRHVIFQVSIDNVPMLGHALFPHAVLNDPPGFVVSNPGDTTSPAASKMVAYDFVARVTPGWHVEMVRFAGCCLTWGYPRSSGQCSRWSTEPERDTLPIVREGAL